jgi:signal transduction histidine kinase
MRQSKRYVILFTSFVGLSTFAMAVVAVLALETAYSHFAAAPNKELAATLWRRMAFDAQVGLLLGALGITAIAIPVGIALWRMSSRRYRGILAQVELLMHERLGLAGLAAIPHDEESAWEEYLPIWMRDLQQIRNQEKMEAWKEGARLLMHELKNPMTPLKLAAQTLVMDGIEANGAVRRIVAATEAMERILGYFKNLVNVEFGAKENLDGRAHLNRYREDLRASGKSVTWEERYLSSSPSKTVTVIAEKTLLQMVMDNLVNNALEAHPDGMVIHVVEGEHFLQMQFLTPDTQLSDPDRIFKPGFSTKGRGRGYGLFLCKTISDYLDLNLRFDQTPMGAVFLFELPKIEKTAFNIVKN